MAGIGGCTSIEGELDNGGVESALGFTGVEPVKSEERAEVERDAIEKVGGGRTVTGDEYPGTVKERVVSETGGD